MPLGASYGHDEQLNEVAMGGSDTWAARLLVKDTMAPLVEE